MNFLAHVQLSKGIPGLIVGNLVADAYKGSSHSVLIKEIQKGVLLHRHIDHFTDTSAETIELKQLLKPHFGRYAGVALDVYFDHFLSVNWQYYNEISLPELVHKTHLTIENHLHNVNELGREFLQKLVRYNWLLAYGDKKELDAIFQQMSHRFRIPNFKYAIGPLEEHYEIINDRFSELYPALTQSTLNFIGLDKL